MVPFKNPDGKRRIVTSFFCLNKLRVVNGTLVPRISRYYDCFEGIEIFYKIDLRQSFFQLSYILIT